MRRMQEKSEREGRETRKGLDLKKDGDVNKNEDPGEERTGMWRS